MPYADSGLTPRTALRETEQLLENERNESAQLRARVSHLEADAQAAQSQIESLTAVEKELTDKSRDQVRLVQTDTQKSLCLLLP